MSFFFIFLKTLLSLYYYRAAIFILQTSIHCLLLACLLLRYLSGAKLLLWWVVACRVVLEWQIWYCLLLTPAADLHKLFQSSHFKLVCKVAGLNTVSSGSLQCELFGAGNHILERFCSTYRPRIFLTRKTEKKIRRYILMWRLPLSMLCVDV